MAPVVALVFALALAAPARAPTVRTDVVERVVQIVGRGAERVPQPHAGTAPSVAALIGVRRARSHAAAIQRDEAATRRCVAAHAAKPATMHALYGAAPATPGTAFGGARIGAFEAPPPWS